MKLEGNPPSFISKTGTRDAAQAGDDAPGDPSLDKMTDGLGIQGVAQDGTRAAALAARRGTALERSARHANQVLAGDRMVLGPAFRQAAKVTATVAPDLQKIAVPALSTVKVLARAGSILGKLGPIISIPFAGYDVFKAVAERDPEKRPEAAANATLTVAGTALGVGAVVVGAGPAAVGLLATSMAVGAFQLVDAYANEGKATRGLGKAAARLADSLT